MIFSSKLIIRDTPPLLVIIYAKYGNDHDRTSRQTDGIDSNIHPARNFSGTYKSSLLCSDLNVFISNISAELNWFDSCAKQHIILTKPANFYHTHVMKMKDWMGKIQQTLVIWGLFHIWSTLNNWVHPTVRRLYVAPDSWNISYIRNYIYAATLNSSRVKTSPRKQYWTIDSNSNLLQACTSMYDKMFIVFYDTWCLFPNHIIV